MHKPLSLVRRDFIDTVCNIINKCDLPAFVVVDVLEKVLVQVRIEADNEIKRDEAMYRKALADEKPKSEVIQDGKDQ